jgi:hypothetical protein
MIVEEDDGNSNMSSDEFGIEVDMSIKVPSDLKAILTNIRKLTSILEKQVTTCVKEVRSDLNKFDISVK